MTRIYINKNPEAKQPFSVSYYSGKRIKKSKKNPIGLELLARCENLPTKRNAITNIKSMATIFKGSFGIHTGYVTVCDNTGKNPINFSVCVRK